MKAAAPYVLGQAMLTAGDVNRGALIRGIDPALRGHGRRHRPPHARRLARELEAGRVRHRARAASWRARARRGARRLRGRDHAARHAHARRHPAAPQDLQGGRHLRSRHDEFDSGLALVNIEDAQRLYRLDGVSGVRLKLDDLFAAPAVARDLCAEAAGRRPRSATGRATTPTSSARCRSRSA